MERLLVVVTIAVVALIAILYVVWQRKRMRFSTIEILKYDRAGIGKVGKLIWKVAAVILSFLETVMLSLGKVRSVAAKSK